MLLGLSATAEGSSTSSVTAEIECALCRVGADQMLAEGDLFVSDEGKLTLDSRPAEYRSVWAFIEYLEEEGRKTFEVEELQELARLSGVVARPYKSALAELRRLGFRLPPRPPAHEVRGIGRLKKAPREER